MSQIRSKNTKPELLVRSILHKMGYRFRIHSKQVPGKPDIVLKKYRAAIFVHGCFWHRHKGCRFCYMPKSRLRFWTSKFQANELRDRRVKKVLRKLGWKVMIIWECQANNIDKVAVKINGLVGAKNGYETP